MIGCKNKDSVLEPRFVFYLLEILLNGVVGIADDAFALSVELELLAGEDVFAGAFAVSLKITRGADICPVDVVVFSERVEGDLVRLDDGHRRLGEGGHVKHGLGMRRVHKQTACAAYDHQTGVFAFQQIGEVLCCVGDDVDGLGRPCACRVYDRVKAVQILGGDRKNILGDGMLRRALVFFSDKGGHVHTALDGFLDDEFACFSVCCYYCDFHDDILLIRLFDFRKSLFS